MNPSALQQTIKKSFLTDHLIVIIPDSQQLKQKNARR